MAINIRKLAWKLDKVFMLRRIRLNKLAGSAGLYMGQLPILAYIAHNEGCTQKEIADWLRISPASIALSTKRLQRAGLIEKTVDQENLRRNMLSVTEKGEETALRHREAENAFDRDMFAGISEPELAQFASTLDALLHNLTDGEGMDVDFVPMMEMDDRIQDRMRMTCPPPCHEPEEPQ